MSIPYLIPFIWFLFFLIIPLIWVLSYSFFKRGPYGTIDFEWNIASYVRTFDWVYLSIFLKSVQLALITAICSFILGFPIALMIVRATPKRKLFYLILILVPFWTNFIVRAFAVKVFLGDYGPINQFLIDLGWLSEPIPFTHHFLAVGFGMVSSYLPFMVLPLYSALEGFDRSLVDAARDLGARSYDIIFKVLLPSIKEGIQSGFILVFVPALGEFVIPSVLGGAKRVYIGTLISDQFLKTRDWPFGSAMTTLLLIWTFVALAVVGRMRRKRAKL